MTKKVSLSIVLPVLNDQENLDRILKEFIANQPDESWELIIVDDGSTKPLSIGSNPPENWRLIHNSKRLGAASARNVGAQKASGEYLVMLSVFLGIPKDYITRMRTFIAETEFDFAQHLIEKAPGLPATKFQSFLANQKGRLSHPGQILSIKQSLFTAAIIKAEEFHGCGGFDESMNHYGGHELDLIYRLDLAGRQKRVSITEIPLERMKLEDQNKIRNRLKEYGNIGLPGLLKKHPELKKTILVKPWLWNILALLGLTRWFEVTLWKKIKADQSVPVLAYRLYLHLIVRNAWDAR